MQHSCSLWLKDNHCIDAHTKACHTESCCITACCRLSFCVTHVVRIGCLLLTVGKDCYIYLQLQVTESNSYVLLQV